MKAVINEIVYDTESAAVLETRTDHEPEDSRHYQEELCQTPEGNFFLHGKGGRDSWYCKVQEDGKRGPGENIIPLSEDQVNAWKTHTFEFHHIF